MVERIARPAASPGRLLACAPVDTGLAGQALDFLAIIVAAVEQAPGMAVRGIDRDGIVRYWSPGAARLYGIRTEQAAGQAWASLAPAASPGFAGELADGFGPELAIVLAGGKARPARLWQIAADGAGPRCFCSTLFPLLDEGLVRHVVCIDVELTAGSQAGMPVGALLLMADNFRQLYDKSADAIVLLRDEHIAEANPAAVALFQCEDRQRLLGRRLSDFSPLRQPGGELSAVLGTQMAARAHADGNCRHEWRYLTCLGQLFWGEVLLTSVTLDHTYLFYAVVRDISARKQAERAFHLAAQVVEHAHEAIVVMDEQQQVLSMNCAYSEISGYRLEDLRGRRFVDIASAEQQAVLGQAWESVLRDGHWQGELLAPRKAGAPYPAWLSLTAIRDHAGQPGNYMAILLDISERKKDEEQTRHLAEHDFLTDLPNRVLLRDRLSLALAAARRKLHMLAVLYLDLDHFKHVNDSMGHDVGDLLLKEVARRLVRCVRGVDTVSRHGGDEFVILLAEVGGADQVAHVAASVLQAVTQVYQLGEYELHVSASIGVSVFPGDGDSIDALMHNADVAMYHAKGRGRDNFQFFNADMNAHIVERASLEHDLRAALDTHEFVLECQPVIAIASGAVVACEALLRWRHPQLGLLLPERFIVVAEECGLMVRIGGWVLRQACLRARAWHDAGHPLAVCVNLCAAQCMQNNLLHSVQEALQDAGLPPACLTLEVTESILMKGGARLMDMLAQLRALGVTISIDDFGTGYSRLGTLRQYPVDKLKIDPSFLQGGDLTVAATIIAMARQLHLLVIAEGVETAQQLDYLQEQGCDQYQGRLASAQVEGSALGKLLTA